MNNIAHILVTGGAGFIGAHTVNALLQQGMRVTVLDNLSSGHASKLIQHKNLELIKDDILNSELLKKLIAPCDAVLHLAAISSVPTAIAQPLYSCQVNVQGFVNVLQAITETNKHIRLVYASSAAVYADTVALPCSDEMHLTTNPLSPYALQKRINEQYADLYARMHGIHALGLRYFNVYGEGQNPHSSYCGVISKFLRTYLSSGEVEIFGDGQQARDFVHISDVVRANILALQNNYNGIVNIGTGQPKTLLELINFIESLGKKPAKINFSQSRLGDIKISYGSIKKAQEKLSFNAFFTLQDGIKELLFAKG